MLELKWSELLDMLPPDACGVYYVLLSIAHGRTVFEISVAELMPMFSEMSRARFDDIVQQLTNYELIAARELPTTTRWLILREPVDWQPTKANDESFLRRVVN